MKKNKEETLMKTTSTIILALLLILLVSSFSSAQPTGTDITYNSTETVNLTEPDFRTDEGGTINTLVVNAIQQNPRWKAYIGNITGSYTLDDSDGNTIFSWALEQTDIVGEIYSSRSNTIDWGNISCADQTIISGEDSFLGLSGVDNINNTFNETTHQEIVIASTNTFNNCPATSTYVNSARQSQASADFQLVLLRDTTSLIYTNHINPSTPGYDNSIFDFQMIVANNPSLTTQYYFYVELG